MSRPTDDDFDELEALNLLPPPASFSKAPEWATELYLEYRALRHRTAGTKMALDAIVQKLGQEPDADGKNGTGLIGDVRKMNRDLAGIMSLRDKGLGFIAAIVVCSAVLVAGLVHLVQSAAHPK